MLSHEHKAIPYHQPERKARAITMSVISAVSRKVSTMADGTLRLTVDIDPRFANDAFQLFGSPDVPMALARLTQDAAQASAQAETIADYADVREKENNRVTGLAMLAVQWCKMPEFWEWLETDDDNAAHSEHGAKLCVTTICGIESRRELNTNKQAAQKFNEEIRAPFMEWLQERDIAA
jgi:hypothetical protein